MLHVLHAIDGGWVSAWPCLSVDSFSVCVHKLARCEHLTDLSDLTVFAVSGGMVVSIIHTDMGLLSVLSWTVGVIWKGLGGSTHRR